jgi:hypothetical protein
MAIYQPSSLVFRYSIMIYVNVIWGITNSEDELSLADTVQKRKSKYWFSFMFLVTWDRIYMHSLSHLQNDKLWEMKNMFSCVWPDIIRRHTTRFTFPRSGTRKLTYHRPTSMAYQTTCNENLTVATFPLVLRKQWVWETKKCSNQLLGASYYVLPEARNCVMTSSASQKSMAYNYRRFDH